MDTLTIVKKFYTTIVEDNSRIWTYEFVETGERFESFSDDAYTAFYDHVRLRELDDMIVNVDPSDVFHEEASPLKLNIAECPFVPEDAPQKTARNEQIEGILVRAYADVLQRDICDLVNKNCEACEIDDPSQDHHDCLMLSREIKVYRYFFEALRDVNDEKVMKIFMKNIETLNPPLNALELLKYQCKDSREDIVSTRREELEDILIDSLN